MTALQRLTYKAAISKTHNKLDLRLQRPMISVTYFCRQKERTVTGFFIWKGGGFYDNALLPDISCDYRLLDIQTP